MTLYFQVQFLIVKCTDNVKSTIENVEKLEKGIPTVKKVSPRTRKS